PSAPDLLGFARLAGVVFGGPAALSGVRLGGRPRRGLRGGGRLLVLVVAIRSEGLDSDGGADQCDGADSEGDELLHDVLLASDRCSGGLTTRSPLRGSPASSRRPCGRHDVPASATGPARRRRRRAGRYREGAVA